MKIESSNSKITARVGRALAEELLATKSRHGVLVALSGELGAGKTTFAQGFMKGLGVRATIQSPTFVLMKKFIIPKKKKSQFKTVFHIDAYRLKRPKELAVLGFGDIVVDRRNIILLEWPEKIKARLPKEYVLVELEHRKAHNERTLTIQEIRK